MHDKVHVQTSEVHRCESELTMIRLQNSRIHSATISAALVLPSPRYVKRIIKKTLVAHKRHDVSSVCNLYKSLNGLRYFGEKEVNFIIVCCQKMQAYGNI